MNTTRKQKLTSGINLKGSGLEIGPLCWPILSRKEAKIFYVDHTTTAGIRELYKHDKGIKQSEIVDVDFPLQGKSLKQTVGGKKFDYILASHVIEHVPDMVAWLDDTASVLKDGGVLSLAIPDKRFTFDIDRNVSRPADVIGAHLDKLTRPNSITVFDYFMNYRSKVDPRQAWDGQLYVSEEAGPHRYSLKDAQKQSLINRDTIEYVDTHCFVYTPSSFVAVMRSLIDLSLTQYEILAFHDTSAGEYEFFVSLRKLPATKQLATIQLKSLPAIDPEPSVRELQAELRQTNAELALLRSEFEHVVHSKSWKITRPLRGVLKTVKRPK